MIHDNKTQKAPDFITSSSLLTSIRLLSFYLVVDAVDVRGNYGYKTQNPVPKLSLMHECIAQSTAFWL
ncbi:hypothetical protein [Nostoc sp. PCC 7524]|uniref:hypothetical protein n=1 Tax=Nostoc sp. (strain ATCC 29411 / PCC 7524) TaxID=28072 RepID=UPI000A3E61FA|nr:hypothetical protein [Nostoc sp. PCC 7524]